LQVKEKIVNHPPVLAGLDNFYPVISLSEMINDAKNLGPVVDPDIGDSVWVKYTV
jgi:hypothetical protein